MLSTTREILVSKRTLWLYTTMGVVLVSFNILLVAQNKGLKAYATRIERSLELQPGTPLPSVEGLGLRGEGIKLDYGVDPRKTLLLVFSNSCKACTDNMPNWEAVVKNIDQRAFRVAAIFVAPGRERVPGPAPAWIDPGACRVGSEEQGRIQPYGDAADHPDQFAGVGREGLDRHDNG